MTIGIDASRAFGDQKTGTETYSYELITRILKLPEAKEHEWILYLRDDPGQVDSKGFLDCARNDNVSVVWIPLKWLWTQVGLAGRTWVDKLDVLWIPAHTLPLLRNPGLKTVVTIHGIEYEWLPAYENVLQRWYLPLSTQYAINSASKLIAVSKFTRDQIIARMGGEADKIDVILEGVDSKKPITKKQDTNNLKILIKFNLKPKKYLLFVGTVQPRKNLVRLIDAFSQLKSDMKLVIAGKLGWNYQDVVETANKNKNVIITGYISDEERQELLKNALAYVQPSITEGFGLPIIEAFQAGIPVVSSNGGALGEIIQIPITNNQDTNKNQITKNNIQTAGLMFDPYNVDEMTNSLKLVVGKQKLRNKLIKLGKERARDFSWDRAAKETLNILTSWNT